MSRPSQAPTHYEVVPHIVSLARGAGLGGSHFGMVIEFIKLIFLVTIISRSSIPHSFGVWIPRIVNMKI